MRVLVVLALIGLSAAQFFQGSRSQGGRRQQQQQVGRNHVDDHNGNSLYHYSWRHGQSPFTGGQARGYCSGLSGGWTAININDASENTYVRNVVAGENLEYIWTGGVKRGRGFSWSDGSSVRYTDWSHTGGNRSPQPDNRDRKGENCLGVLNNFYNDGIKWHDIECSHRKPVICEKKA